SLLLFYPFYAPAPAHIYTLSLHDALPISWLQQQPRVCFSRGSDSFSRSDYVSRIRDPLGSRVSCNPQQQSLSSGRRIEKPARERSEEHTSELQSLTNLVCRLLLEKKKNQP